VLRPLAGTALAWGLLIIAGLGVLLMLDRRRRVDARRRASEASRARTFLAGVAAGSISLASIAAYADSERLYPFWLYPLFWLMVLLPVILGVLLFLRWMRRRFPTMVEPFKSGELPLERLPFPAAAWFVATVTLALIPGAIGFGLLFM
jgi:hypothetical protein